MATPVLSARLSTPAEAINVLYTDEPPPHAPDRLLKTIRVSAVTVADDPAWVAGGDRLIEITLDDEAEIRPRRRFDLRTVIGGVVSTASALGFVPAQLVDSNGVPLFASDGLPLIPAPTPSVPKQLRDANGEPLYDSQGQPIFPTP